MMRHLADLVRRATCDRLRWAFDPTSIRNAHFYLDVIGARGRQFVPDMYGADPGRPSHRVIADWDLRRRPRTLAPALRSSAARHAAPGRLLRLLTVERGKTPPRP